MTKLASFIPAIFEIDLGVILDKQSESWLLLDISHQEVDTLYNGMNDTFQYVHSELEPLHLEIRNVSVQKSIFIKIVPDGGLKRGSEVLEIPLNIDAEAYPKLYGMTILLNYNDDINDYQWSFKNSS